MPNAKGFFYLLNMKTCIKCNIEKTLNKFTRDKSKKGIFFQDECKECRKEYLRKEYIRQYYIKNKEHIKEAQKKYALNNIEKIKQYHLINSEKRRQRQSNRKKTDYLYKLSGNIRSLISISIKNQGYKKTSKTYDILGCSFEEFKTHLENQFTEGMTWENQGKWHLDHIYPVSRATDEEHLIKLNHYTNFQPLWAIDNFKKGNRIIPKC